MELTTAETIIDITDMLSYFLFIGIPLVLLILKNNDDGGNGGSGLLS